MNYEVSLSNCQLNGIRVFILFFFYYKVINKSFIKRPQEQMKRLIFETCHNCVLLRQYLHLGHFYFDVNSVHTFPIKSLSRIFMYITSIIHTPYTQKKQ